MTLLHLQFTPVCAVLLRCLGGFGGGLGLHPSPLFTRPVQGLWRRSGRSSRPVCGGCGRWRWSAAADKMVKVLKAESRCQHHSGPWLSASSSAISPARITAKPFPPCCGLPKNEAVETEDFTGCATWQAVHLFPQMLETDIRRCRQMSVSLLVGVAPQTP